MTHGDEKLPRRLWNKITIDNGCWLWAGAKSRGYGQAIYSGRVQYVHRIVYEALKKPVDRGFELDHLCRNRACVNPLHLEPVSHQTNVVRGEAPMAVKLRHSRRTHCKRGHEFTAENTYQRPTGRECRECWKQRKST